MKVNLEKTHEVDAPPAAAWNVLKDINVLAECMPGASITEETGENAYKGQVSVKVGPVQSVFGGAIDITSIDEAARSIALDAKGRDKTGTSNAAMSLTAEVRETESGGSEIIGNSEITVNGKLANFGARMINGVADQLIDQFLANYTNRVLAEGEGAAAEEAAERVAEQPKELSAFGLLFGMIADFFRKLFGKKDDS
jgi:carbon monoxide dehydrogenase subunit G